MQDGYYWATHKQYGRAIVLIESSDAGEDPAYTDVMPLGADVCCDIDDYEDFSGPLEPPAIEPSATATGPGYYWVESPKERGRKFIVDVYGDPVLSGGIGFDVRQAGVVGDSFAMNVTDFIEFIGPLTEDFPKG